MTRFTPDLLAGSAAELIDAPAIESSVVELAETTDVVETKDSHGNEAREVPASEVRDADEVFISSTAGGIIPITRVDGRPVGDGAPGPLTRRLRDSYWELHRDPRFATPVPYD